MAQNWTANGVTATSKVASAGERLAQYRLGAALARRHKLTVYTAEHAETGDTVRPTRAWAGRGCVICFVLFFSFSSLRCVFL